MVNKDGRMFHTNAQHHLNERASNQACVCFGISLFTIRSSETPAMVKECGANVHVEQASIRVTKC